MNRSILSAALEGVRDEYIQEAATPPRRRTARQVVVLAVAAALCLALALPAVAASEEGYELMYTVAPAVAQYFKPIQMSCEDNGIEMEVISAYIHGDTAEAYIALRDLTGDRIDGTVDLFDSYDIHIPFDSISTCRLESYDPDTHTALFYIRNQFSSMDGQPLPPQDGKITFSVRKFLSHKQSIEQFDLSAALADMPAEPAARTDMPLRGGSGLVWAEDQESPPCLVPLAEPLLVPADGVAVTAVGYVEGKLHIQIRYEDILRTDNHGFLYCVDPDGRIVACSNSLSFWDEDGSSSYEDYMFDIPQGELSRYGIFGDFYTCDCLTEGNWQVTFPLDAD